MNPLTRTARCCTLFHAVLFIFCLSLASIDRANAQLIYADSFNYPDGQIETSPGSPWVCNYFPTNQISVVSGRLFLTQSNQESIRYDFPQPFSAGALYARLVVNVSRLQARERNL